MSDVAPKINFDALPEQQQTVLGFIAINEDEGHDERIVRALMRRGLVVRKTVCGVTHYAVPISVHIQWCQWCSTKVKEEEDVQ